ncbi:MAG TPA: glycoside hydrolase family 6 protein [Polyangiaceae bacterium]|nr:glycoside hydrolase family 6 protein [Polyangiaceae bacterium]
MSKGRAGRSRAARFVIVLAAPALAVLAGCGGSEPRDAAGSVDGAVPESSAGSQGSAPSESPTASPGSVTPQSNGAPQSSAMSESPVAAGGPASSGSATSSPAALPAGNPFASLPLYVYPGTWAAKAVEMLQASSPEEAALARKIAEHPAAEWFSYPYEQIAAQVDSYVSAAAGAGALPVLVPYHLPNRDCGLYSAGGAEDPQAYRDWAAAFVAAIGDRPAVVVLEPDSLPQLDTCLSPPDQEQRLELTRSFAQALSALPSTAVYLDAGHSSWVPAEVMAQRLLQAGIAEVRGFSLNVSNYQRDEDLVRYGHDLIARLGIDTHFVIDSSRNGNGPATGPESWCNPTGRALGRAPTADTQDPALDAYLWVKRPGESDGECAGGPAPGLWFPERAYELARNSTW